MSANLTSYGRKVAGRGVDFQVMAGESYGLIGPDGAGKSSVLKAISGVLSYDAGHVEVFHVGVESERSAELIKDRIGFMPQGLGLNLYPDLSIEENIDFFARVRLVPEDELRRRKRRLLGMTRLDRFRTRPMKNLSGGMKQKLALVCTLVHEPQLIVLDEPTTGIDPVSRRDFWAVLAELMHEQGITAIMSTAYLEEASRFDRITLLHEGRVIASGEPESILDQVPGSKVVVSATPQIEAMTRLRARFSHSEAFGDSIEAFAEELSPDDATLEVRQLLEGLAVTDIQVTDRGLEDVFLVLLRRQEKLETKGTTMSAIQMMRAAPCADESFSHGSGIEAQGLVRDFGSFRAVDDVNLSVKAGEIFGLLGANGAGKTTVIKMLTGILKPTKGTVRIAGDDSRSRQARKRIGYMSQVFSLYPDLSVLQNIRLYAGIYGMSRADARECGEYLLNVTGLSQQVGQLAGRLPVGMRQRLALACALVHNPQILFLDEPTSGVDPNGRRFFWEVLQTLSREHGVTILVTTHYMAEAEHCDRLALMYDGRVITDATPNEMKDAVAREAGNVLSLWTDKPFESLKHVQRNGYPNAALLGKQVQLLTLAPDETAGRLHDHLRNANVRVIKTEQLPLSMEHVFVHRVLEQEHNRGQAR